MSSKDGYKNSKLYYHQKSNTTGTIGYWIASPSENETYKLLHVTYDSTISDYAMNDSSTGLRPVVSLNSGVTVNATDPE